MKQKTQLIKNLSKIQRRGIMLHPTTKDSLDNPII